MLAAMLWAGHCVEIHYVENLLFPAYLNCPESEQSQVFFMNI